MIISIKQHRNTINRLVDYYDQEGIRFVLCTAVTKEERVRHRHIANQYCLDAIKTLHYSAVELLAEADFSDETVSGYQRSLDKSMDEFISIYRQKEALKKESKVVTPISSFKKGGRA